MRELTSIAGTQGAAVASRLKIMGGLDIAERRAPQDGRVSIRRGNDSIDVRIAILPTTHGEKVTLRILAQGEAPDSLDALGMWPGSRAALERAITQPFGAVVVVGPTGSGKTTTLYTCLQMLNTPDRQLTTIEDPVEYRAAGLDQIEVNPRAGLTFANGLRTVLRSDPDVLLVGEIRDEETAQIAFRAAMTGHLVLTTLHAQTAASAIQRLTDMEIERSILATSINCIIGQRLARRVCQSCCEPTTPDPAVLRALARAGRLRRAELLPGRRLRRMRRDRIPRPRASLRGDDDDGRDRAARRRPDPRDRGDGDRAGHVHASRGRRPPRDGRAHDARGGPPGRRRRGH